MQVAHVAVRNLCRFQYAPGHQHDVGLAHAPGIDHGRIVGRTFAELDDKLFIGAEEEGHLGFGGLQSIGLGVGVRIIRDELLNFGAPELSQKRIDFGGVGSSDGGFGQGKHPVGPVKLHGKATAGGADLQPVHGDARPGQQRGVAPVIVRARQSVHQFGVDHVDGRLAERLHVDPVAHGRSGAVENLRALAVVLQGQSGSRDVEAELGDGALAGFEFLGRDLRLRQPLFEGLQQPLDGIGLGRVGDGHRQEPGCIRPGPFDAEDQLIGEPKLNVGDFIGFEGEPTSRRDLGVRDVPLDQDDEGEQPRSQSEQQPRGLPVHGGRLGVMACSGLARGFIAAAATRPALRATRPIRERRPSEPNGRWSTARRSSSVCNR